MEQARLLLAIGLSFLVLFVWSMFFTEKPPVNQTAETETVEQAAMPVDRDEREQPPAAANETVQPAVKTAGTSQATEIQASREIKVETPFYNVRITTRGATVTSYVLNEYREAVEVDAPKKQLIPKEIQGGLFHASMSNRSIQGLEDAVFTVDRNESDIRVNEEKKSLALHWISKDGVTVSKIFTFDPQSYMIDLKIVLSNNGIERVADSLELSLRSPVMKDKGYGFVGPSALIDSKLEQVKAKKIEDKNEFNGKISWIGVEDRYFISSIIPGEETEGRMKLALNDETITNKLVNPAFELAPGSSKEFQFYLFMGPKSMDLLSHLGHGLDKALNFGFFDILAKPCLWFMNQIHSVIPNYGVAIILLTIFTKILLWPLGNKSYKSMSEMKKLQPLMTEIREKYKDDKQKMNQELMALYRTYKVNPMGGCLPMVLQIPVFFALYRMLYQAIELRHAPFFLWINDLSAPDRLFDFGFSIPFMEPPYGIPVLTIVMGATMLLQQKMSPPPGDPTQAKMMMLMPLVFTFIFINFSSGLVLYWLVNNVLSISQQYYVQKKNQ
ncbi:membrane protein insertase YidC [uncultured Desulfosarcina sp.]|uniref:membrane protein insertase YidC n=1 Tax=uncultured Desulfosarcina sp. TaxID=218289 RepID=UPI0029C96786|nr:membrane protein insertase YidC [uncultured Desulfosarcina sp.]